MLAYLDAARAGFDGELEALLARASAGEAEVRGVVGEVVAAVRERGDAALGEFTEKFDGFAVGEVGELEVSREVRREALAGLAKQTRQTRETREALEFAAGRIRAYHERELENARGSWEYTEADGTRLGQRVSPLARVGIYVPGGKAAYPSSVLMNAIPAAVAGVGEVVMAVPTPGGEVNQAVLAAAELAGVGRVFRIGGAQAIAAMAYGTGLVPAVDKIVGPGNRYVTAAKRQVFGRVGIDMLAGPSEVVVVCDAGANSDWVAMDLCAQAEHDEAAQAIAITDSAEMAAAIGGSLERLVGGLARREIVERALAGQGAVIKVKDIGEAVAVANRIAPEHLELMVEDARRWVGEVKHAGAIFVGAYSAEALGDYCAGANHVLPTAGAARFRSPLGVDDFVKHSSVIEASREGAARMAEVAAVLARCEGLEAHARSAEYRLAQEKGRGAG